MNSYPPLKYSPALSDLILEGLTEVLGEARMEDLAASLDASLAPFDLESLRQALVMAYGNHSAAGMMVRAGRAAFSRLLLRYAAELGFEEQTFRLLAPRRKMLTALQRLANWLGIQGAGEFEVGVEEGYWQWFDRAGFEGAGIPRLWPACPFLLGMLQELTYWVSSGRVYPIREKDLPQGCVLEITQKPLD